MYQYVKIIVNQSSDLLGHSVKKYLKIEQVRIGSGGGWENLCSIIFDNAHVLTIQYKKLCYRRRTARRDV